MVTQALNPVTVQGELNGVLLNPAEPYENLREIAGA